jgi:prepilin-type N-terminal cleavage/methylation domain-containing protein
MNKRGATSLTDGFSLVECLIVVMILAGFSLIGLRMATSFLAGERVEAATRRIADGLELGRLAAIRSARACGLRLAGTGGWQAPEAGRVQACSMVRVDQGDGSALGDLQLEHNLPDVVRFTSNGLIIDGGTIKVTEPGAGFTRCLVISLPLGVVRVGRWDSEQCHSDRVSGAVMERDLPAEQISALNMPSMEGA